MVTNLYARKRKMSIKNKLTLFDFVNGFLIGIVILICAYPLYYTIIASFSDPNAVISGRVYLWPVKFTLDSYSAVLNYSQIWLSYRNTIVYTTFGTMWNLFVLIPAAYAMSKKGLKGRNAIMGYFVITMYFSGGLVPYYLLMRELDLIDNPLVMIIPRALSVYNMIIARTYFSNNFSQDLSDAAKIDGAGEFRVFVQIAIPLSSAIIAVMTLYHAVFRWNSYFNALLFLNNIKYYPLQLVLRQILVLNQSISLDTSSMSAEAMADLLRRKRLAETMKYSLIIIANLPVLMAYPFAQKYFVKGVMIGSVKG